MPPSFPRPRSREEQRALAAAILLLLVTCPLGAQTGAERGGAAGEPTGAPESRPAPDSRPAAPEGIAPVVVDVETAKRLDRMDDLLYTVAKAGARKVFFRGDAEIRLAPESDATVCRFAYLWDGTAKYPQGRLVPSDLEGGRHLAQFRIQAETFDLVLAARPWREDFRGCKLRSVASGDDVRVEIDGDPKGRRSLLIGRDGVPVETVVEPPGTGVSITLKIEYTKVAERFARSRVHSDFQTAAGAGTMEVKLEYGVAGGYHVITKQTVSTHSPPAKLGTVTIRFGDYEFNDDVTPDDLEPKPAVPPVEPRK